LSITCFILSSSPLEAGFYSFFKSIKSALSGEIDDLAKKEAKYAAKNVAKTTGGSSTVLAYRIGISKMKNWAAHHIIPVELKSHRALNKIGMDMDEIENGIALPTMPGLDPNLPLHRGSHPSYTAAVKMALDKIPPDASIAETRRMVSEIQQNFRNKLISGTPLHTNYGAPDPWY
jgi:hypothetical protein